MSNPNEIPALHRFLRDEQRAGTLVLVWVTALNAMLFILALTAMTVLQ